MDNQASEDELIYGVDQGIHGGDSTALSIKKGSTLYAFVGDEAVAIIDVIRTEKLKLLAEVRSNLLEMRELKENRDNKGILWGSYDVVDLDDIREVLNKLEAEL